MPVLANLALLLTYQQDVNNNKPLVNNTSSPAVADRPHDFSCLSVSSIVQYIERNLSLLVRPTLASNLPMRTVKFCSVVLGIDLSTDKNMSRLAVINKIH